MLVSLSEKQVAQKNVSQYFKMFSFLKVLVKLDFKQKLYRRKIRYLDITVTLCDFQGPLRSNSFFIKNVCL